MRAVLPEDGATRWIQVYNASGEEIPAYALMRISGILSTGEIQVAKPNADGQSDILVNGWLPIAAGDYGQAHLESPCQVLYDSGDGTPTIGQTWGAESGSWKANKNKAGAKIIGGIDSTFVTVSVLHGWGGPSAVAAGSSYVISAQTSSFNVGAFSYFYTIDVSGGAVTATLPAVAGNAGLRIGFKLIGNVAGNTQAATIDGNGAETIDGDANQVLQIVDDEMTLVCGASEWHIENDGRQNHSVRVTNSGAQTLTNNTTTAITFDTETWDSCGLHSVSSNTSRLTAVRAGTYQVNGNGQFAANATGLRTVSIRAGGATVYSVCSQPSSGAGGVTALQVSCLVDLAAAGYVELLGFQTSGGDLSFSGQKFDMVMVAPKYS